VTAMPAVPTATFTCSGLSNDLASSRSARGRGILGRVVVVGDSAVLTLLAPPTIYTQMAGTGRAAVGWHLFLSMPVVPNPGQPGGDLSRRAAHEEIGRPFAASMSITAESTAVSTR